MKYYYSILLVFTLLSTFTLAQSSSTENLDTPGLIRFEFNVDSAFLIVNNQFDEMRWIKNGDSISLKKGLTSIKLSVIHDYLFEEVFTLKPGEDKTITHNFKNLPLTKKVLTGNYAARQLFDANLLVVTDEKSEIILNKEYVGTEYAFTNGELGKNEIEVKNPSFYSSAFFTSTVNFNNSDRTLKVIERYIKPRKSRSRQLALLPGFSQAYKYEFLKSNLIRIGLAVAFVSTSTFEIKYRINKKEFDDLLFDYQNTQSFITATGLGNKLEELEPKLERDALIRNISLFSLISVYS